MTGGVSGVDGGVAVVGVSGEVGASGSVGLVPCGVPAGTELGFEQLIENVSMRIVIIVETIFKYDDTERFIECLQKKTNQRTGN